MTELKIVELTDRVGDALGASPWVMIDQTMIDAFAELTGDHQWIHVDVDRAAREANGTIAHGFLVLSLMGRLTGEIASFSDMRMGLNYGLDRIRFLSPVPAGSEIRLHEILAGVEPRGSGVLVKRECRIERRGDDRPAVVADWLSLYYADAH